MEHNELKELLEKNNSEINLKYIKLNIMSVIVVALIGLTSTFLVSYNNFRIEKEKMNNQLTIQKNLNEQELKKIKYTTEYNNRLNKFSSYVDALIPQLFLYINLLIKKTNLIMNHISIIFLKHILNLCHILTLINILIFLEKMKI